MLLLKEHNAILKQSIYLSNTIAETNLFQFSTKKTKH